MATVALAWELGEGHGHVHTLAPIGLALRERGHQLVVIARELHRAEGAFGGLGVPILQAPLAARPQAKLGRLHTVGEALRPCGYDHVGHFGPIYRAWRVLLESIGASLVIGDFSPTAGLAARGLGVPFVNVGTGYTVPPVRTPTPHLWPWESPPARPERLAREGAVLEVINDALMRCDDAPLTSLAEVFEATDRILVTFAELDHFGPRPHARYFGTLAAGHARAPPPWPAERGRRVFVYVSARHWGFDRLIAQLAAAGHPTVVHARDLDAARAAELAGPTLRFSEAIVDIDAAARDAAVVVAHGGHGTTSRVLLAGRPLLVLPEHSEQALLGHRLSSQGLAIDVGIRRDVAHDYAGLVGRLLDDPAFAAAANELAERHRAYDQDATVAEIAERCAALVR